MSPDLKPVAEALTLIRAFGDDTSHGVADKALALVKAHDCMATVEAFCGKPTETDRADNAEAERDRLRQALVLIEVQVSSDESRASNVLATIGRMARAALAGRPL